MIDATTMPDAAELPRAHTAWCVWAARPATRARLAVLAAHGRGRDRALERRLGELVAATR